MAIDKQKLLEIASRLISIPSVSPQDGGCQPYIRSLLEQEGFVTEDFTFDDTVNSLITYGKEGPIFCFAGHVDVVPPGELNAWKYPPFQPTIEDGMLYGRGAADMKGSDAAFILAATDFVRRFPDFPGRIALLLTSDEEADFVNGTTRVVDELIHRGTVFDYCMVGEPSCSEKLGDTIRIGRRGSVTARITFHGIQGHVANPQNALNPIHHCLDVLKKLTQIVWDKGNEHFPPTSLQIPYFSAGTGATNVIPGEARVIINWRFCPQTSLNLIKQVTEDMLNKNNFPYTIEWSFSGDPYITNTGGFINIVRDAIKDYLGVVPELSTGGGTSDGRFLAKMSREILEFGPCNKTIHKVNECVGIDELFDLAIVYQNILRKVFRV
ncbi:MAG: succinyl-diaminopimelate desuccinylase [Succinivibrionaceae bacterium]